MQYCSIDGITGAQIGSTIAGDIVGDQLGSESITALANNRFCCCLADGYRGWHSVCGPRSAAGRWHNQAIEQIGSTIAGDTTGDQLGIGSITVLVNDNFVIASPEDDEAGVTNAGSIILVNGVTGSQIGSTIAGDTRR